MTKSRCSNRELVKMLENKKILLIDDDLVLCQAIELGLSSQGAKVCTATNGKLGIQSLRKNQPDLVLLDIRMPEMDGWETMGALQNIEPVPIIMLTSVTNEHEVVRGLRQGAVDYITKPFNFDVLLARIENVFRQQNGTTLEDNEVFDDGYLYMDLHRRIVRIEGKHVKLSPKEFKMLEHLYRHAGSPLSFESILSAVWGWEYQESTHYVHVYLSKLRNKLERNASNPRYLTTEYGYGYGFYKN